MKDIRIVDQHGYPQARLEDCTSWCILNNAERTELHRALDLRRSMPNSQDYGNEPVMTFTGPNSSAEVSNGMRKTLTRELIDGRGNLRLATTARDHLLE